MTVHETEFPPTVDVRPSVSFVDGFENKYVVAELLHEGAVPALVDDSEVLQETGHEAALITDGVGPLVAESLKELHEKKYVEEAVSFTKMGLMAWSLDTGHQYDKVEDREFV